MEYWKSQPNAKSNLLARYFADQSTIDDHGNPTQLLRPKTEQKLDICGIDSNEVLDQLKLVNSSKARAPDNIPPSLLKECSNELTAPLMPVLKICLLRVFRPYGSKWPVWTHFLSDFNLWK